MSRSALLRPLALLLLTACVGPTTETLDVSELPPPPPRLTVEPWTDAFEAQAVLVAQRIEISAPDRIADQFVARQDPGNVAVSIETTEAGLRQVYRSLNATADAQGQLDGWSLVATEELVVLQRPGQVDVEIRAQGEAFFQEVGKGGPQRAGQLTFHGEVDWPR